MLVDRVVILEKKVVMIMAVKEDCGKVAGPQECAGCGKKIHDKFLLKVTQLIVDILLWGFNMQVKHIF